MYPKEIRSGYIRKRFFHIIPYGTTVNNDTQMQEVCSNTIKRHCCPERSAEIDKRGSDPCIRIERFIRKTYSMALPAGEPFNKNMHRLQIVVFLDDRKLFFFGVIS